MEIAPPDEAEIRALARRNGFELTDEELDDYTALAAEFLESYERLDDLPVPEVSQPNRELSGGQLPETDPLNAWVTRCDVGGGTGPLAGYDIALKDNISVAGVSLTCGSEIFDDYVPTKDATVTTRLVDAGARIVGKANMDDLAQAASGELSATGPVRNPRDPNHLAGGSSSGAAALVAAGEVDAAIGTDQGGSIRIPAAWCGCVGLKPTYGLVPYTGIVSGGHTVDHAGPLARSVRDCARVLDAVTGPDPLDHRQSPYGRNPPPFESALEAEGDVAVGRLDQGFGRDDADPEVDQTVRGAVEEIGDAGARVESVDVPAHHDGIPVWSAILTEEVAQIVRTGGVGRFVGGHYDTDLLEAFASGRRARSDKFPPVLKLTLMISSFLNEDQYGQHYARAKNLSRWLTSAYDDAFDRADVDVLALPTAITTAHECDPNASRRECVHRAFTVTNTAPFNVTGHPAISVPCGEVDGLPVGAMLVARRNDDRTLLRAAQFLEQTVTTSDDGRAA
ncbi:amidase family protein [Halovenus marina]|uniref:amidase family protein n=1 Tax=Halovenus marina TaxID=3396621 RepID=UPI003F55244C